MRWLGWMSVGAIVSVAGCTSTDVCKGCGEPGEALSYVISAVDVPTATDGLAPGFDLDERNDPGGGDGCVADATDFISRNGAVGVDNQLSGALVEALAPLLLGDTVGGLITEQIDGGAFLLVMELSDVDDAESDGSVFLRLYLAAVGGGATPVIGPDGRLAPAQDFDVTMEIAGDIAGVIEDGRLRVTLPTLPITLATDGDAATLTLRRVHLEADFRESTLTNGELGAQISVADLLTTAERIMPGALTEPVVRDLADLDPDPTDDDVCNAISIGLTFDAVATVNN